MGLEYKTVRALWEGKEIVFETGKLAKQADGSVLVRFGETLVLVTAVRSKTPKPPQPFVPLTVNYLEQTYAAGKIPGGFFKREGKPTEKEVHVSRLIDRPLRPLFPKGYPYEVQVIATVVSADSIHDPEISAILGASLAVNLSDIPFPGPLGAVRVGRVEGKLVANPSLEEQARSDLDLVVVSSKDSIVMVEAGARFILEEALVDALEFGFRASQRVIELQEKLIQEVAPVKHPLPEGGLYSPELYEEVKRQYRDPLVQACRIREKKERYKAYQNLLESILLSLGKTHEGVDRTQELVEIFEDLKREVVREMVVKEKVRVDGRDPRSVRPIEIDVGFLPRAHGSALFTRGETQALVSVTLGSQEDEQKLATLEGETWKRFYLHYNFPPYSVGEVRPLRAPGRREIGHGLLAERAVQPVLPEESVFPYTIRVVSDITESNGSSSMASVCGASLALMDAGVPITTHVAGVAMGLVKEGDEFIILTDILGDEDHLGDMDFKVAGTRDGVTALQMDIKISGVTREILTLALEEARRARMHVLDLMEKAIAVPRPELKPFVPRVEILPIAVEKIGDVIGPGGKTIRGIIQETGVKIDIDDTGWIRIYGNDPQAVQKARAKIEAIVKEVQPGEIYTGVVKKIVDFGAFVEIGPGTQGLVHISEIAHRRIRSVRDVLREGDQIRVMVVDVDPSGRIRLSMKRIQDQGNSPPSS
jgi:polyribonucleotide nucleotidyltransferase